MRSTDRGMCGVGCSRAAGCMRQCPSKLVKQSQHGFVTQACSLNRISAPWLHCVRHAERTAVMCTREDWPCSSPEEARRVGSKGKAATRSARAGWTRRAWSECAKEIEPESRERITRSRTRASRRRSRLSRTQRAVAGRVEETTRRYFLYITFFRPCATRAETTLQPMVDPLSFPALRRDIIIASSILSRAPFLMFSARRE